MQIQPAASHLALAESMALAETGTGLAGRPAGGRAAGLGFCVICCFGLLGKSRINHVTTSSCPNKNV